VRGRGGLAIDEEIGRRKGGGRGKRLEGGRRRGK